MNTQQKMELERITNIKRSGRRLTAKQKCQLKSFQAKMESEEKVERYQFA